MSAANGDSPCDLVVVALAGVQRFIGESRTTSDLASASEIIGVLARTAARTCVELGGTLVLPGAAQEDTTADVNSGDIRGVPNRIVALAAAGTGAQLAGDVVTAIRTRWAEWVGETYAEPPRRDPDTPGMPDVAWVSVPAKIGDYATRWAVAQRALAARRRIRDFDAVDVPRRPVCSLSARWPAANPPRKARRHHRDERLSRTNWVKRQWGLLSVGSDTTRFPSTYSIASATFRRAVAGYLADQAVADAVQRLRRVVDQLPGTRETPVAGLPADGTEPARWLAASAGPWVHGERWQDAALRGVFEEADRDAPDERIGDIAARGAGALRTLLALMAEREVPEPAGYLAVIARDLDGMGAFLSGDGRAADGRTIAVTAAEHRRISAELRAVAGRQFDALRGGDLLGVPIYAGGDDLLTFVPAATALAAAERMQAEALAPPSLPTASTAVLFFHQHASLRRAVAEVQALLGAAKESVPGKHAVAVGFLRHSGVRAESIQPWSPATGGTTVIDLFRMLGGGQTFPLSPGLVADLDRDERELARLAEMADLSADFYAAEIRRLVGRHTGGPRGDLRTARVAEAATALVELGRRERSSGGGPVPAARVGVFLRQEAR